jgi:hypothetical protein
MKNFKTLKRSYVEGAKKRNLDFLLTAKEFEELIKKPCFYCGQINPSGFNGVDRVENSKGYVIENVVSCCTKCNRMKSNFHYREFIDHCVTIRNYQEEKINGR